MAAYQYSESSSLADSSIHRSAFRLRTVSPRPLPHDPPRVLRPLPRQCCRNVAVDPLVQPCDRGAKFGVEVHRSAHCTTASIHCGTQNASSTSGTHSHGWRSNMVIPHPALHGIARTTDRHRRRIWSPPRSVPSPLRTWHIAAAYRDSASRSMLNVLTETARGDARLAKCLRSFRTQRWRMVLACSGLVDMHHPFATYVAAA